MMFTIKIVIKNIKSVLKITFFAQIVENSGQYLIKR